MKSWKRRVMVRTKEGFEVKAWQNAKTGEVTPTNWKIAAGHLAGPVPLTQRQANKFKRKNGVVALQNLMRVRGGAVHA